MLEEAFHSPFWNDFKPLWLFWLCSFIFISLSCQSIKRQTITKNRTLRTEEPGSMIQRVWVSQEKRIPDDYHNVITIQEEDCLLVKVTETEKKVIQTCCVRATILVLHRMSFFILSHSLSLPATIILSGMARYTHLLSFCLFPSNGLLSQMSSGPDTDLFCSYNVITPDSAAVNEGPTASKDHSRISWLRGKGP